MKLLNAIGVAVALLATPVAAQDFRLSADSVAALSKRARPGATLELERANAPSVTLRELAVYAPEARVFVVDEQGTREIARSDWRHFVPLASDVGGVRVTVSIAPDGRAAIGTLFADDGNTYALKSRLGKSGDLSIVRGARAPAEEFLCSNTASFERANDWRLVSDSLASVDPAARPTGKAASRTATIAVDTDFELLNVKFAGNTGNATNYLAALFAAMNVIYERDLDLTLLQGDVFLQTNVADPYPSTSATPATDQLDEFGEFWRTQRAAVNRAFAMMISGKQQSSNSASGIAWVGNGSNYCLRKGSTFPSGSCADGTCTAGHYSVSRVFKFAGSTASNDVLVAAHELGHNFGLSHTHCTDSASGSADVTTNTIDQCYNTEGGCYAGPKSCPAPTTVNGVANVTGTLMSYCHLSGIGCTSALVFADRNRSTLLPFVASNVTAGCFSASSGQAPVVFANGFE